MRRYLGHACTRAGQYEEALEHLHESLAWATEAHDLAGQIHTHRALSWVWGHQYDSQRALDHAIRSLDVFANFDHPVWKARALNAVGWYSALLDRYEQASTSWEAALELFRRHGDQDGEAATWECLGHGAHRVGRHQAALRYYAAAIALCRRTGNAYNEANSLESLGAVHVDLGDIDDARVAWRRAAALFRSQLRADSADRVQRLLAALENRSST